MSLLSFLQHQFYSNQFLTAAVVAAPVSVLAYSVKTVPGKIYEFLKHNVTMEVTFRSDMSEYYKLQRFVMERLVYRKMTKNFMFHAETSWNDVTEDYELENFGLMAGYGVHLGRWRGRLVWINRTQEKSDITEKFKETISLTFLGRDRKIISDFIDKMWTEITVGEEETTVPILVNDGVHWAKMSSIPPRPISTVVTPNFEVERVVAHVRKFEQDKSWYRARGLPYHTGILVHGRPGSGKTSLIQAVAAECGRTLYYLNLAAVETDRMLTHLIVGINAARGFVVLEDIDVTGVKVERKSKEITKVKLSTLLNFLDGSMSPDGAIILATTNHLDSLDPALVRRGRFDLSLEIGDLGWPEFLRMAELFELSEDRVRAVAPYYRPTVGAVVRGLLASADKSELQSYYEEKTDDGQRDPVGVPESSRQGGHDGLLVVRSLPEQDVHVPERSAG